MKRLIVTVLVIFLVLQLSAAGGKKRGVDSLKFPPLNPLKLPAVANIQTANGIQLRLIRDDQLPLVDLEIMVRGGSAYDPAQLPGLADATAQLLRIGGAGDLASDQFDQLLDSNGIDLSVYASNDYFRISLSCLRENLDTALAALARMLTAPRFAEDKLVEIKTQMGSAISRRNDEPNGIISREFSRLIYGDDSPFGWVQEYDQVEAISPAVVGECYKRFFAPGNMLAGCVGPLEINELKQLVEKYLGAWQAQATVPAYPQVKEKSHDFKVALANKANLNQSYIAIGHLGVRYDLPEQAKIMVFNQIFSQGFDSRLFNRVRSKMGLTYGVGGSIGTPYLYPGTVTYDTFTKSETTVDAIKAIFDEIAIIQKSKVGQSELDAAKEYFLNSFVFRYSTPEQILFNELNREFYGLPQGYLDKLLSDLKKVNADDVQAVANRYLNPNNMIILVVANEKDVAAKLPELGKIKKIDIAIKPATPKEKIPPATAETLKQGKTLLGAALKKNYGGYGKLKSLVVEAETSLTLPQGTMMVKSKNSNLFPDKIRQEMTLPFGKMEVIIDGNHGVQKMMNREQPLPEEEIKKDRFGDLYELVSNPDKFSVQYLKEENLNGQVYDVLYIFDAEKRWVKFFVNRKSGLIEMEEKQNNLMGQEGVYRTVNSDFKTVGGIAFAYKSETFLKEKKVMSTVIKNIQPNVALDPAQFKIK